MAHLHTPQLQLPINGYKVNSYKFKQKCRYRRVDWGIHLGEDMNCPAGTKVRAIGRGRVVYSTQHAGTKEKPNWGNIIIIVHKNPKTKKIFYSLYAHLAKRLVIHGQKVEIGQYLGAVGKKNTGQNGWWPEAHLHFSIYTGPPVKQVPPGYFKPGNKRTRLSYWQEPTKFVKKYDTAVL